MKVFAPDGLASWENEGGSTAPALSVARQPFANPAVQGAKCRNIIGAVSSSADDAVLDTNTRPILRVSLLLLVPAMGAITIFWGLLAGSARQ
jgi:hypothetical protein